MHLQVVVVVSSRSAATHFALSLLIGAAINRALSDTRNHGARKQANKALALTSLPGLKN